MIQLALGSVADWNALTSVQQAVFSARYDNLYAAWQYLDTIDAPLPDSYRLVYIGNVTENNSWPGTAVDMRTGLNYYIEVTSLNSSIVVTVQNTLKFDMSMLPGGIASNFRMHDVNFSCVNGGAATPVVRFRGGASDNLIVHFYNNTMIGSSNTPLQGIMIDLDDASYGHKEYIYLYNLKLGRCYIGIRINFPANVGWTPRTHIENVTIDCRTTGARGITTYDTTLNKSYQYTMKNVVVFGSSVGVGPGDFVPNPNAAIPSIINCACGDNSIATNFPAAVNCKNGIVAADEFHSLAYDNAKYLYLKEGIIDLSASRSPAGNLATKQKCLFTPSLSFDPSTCTIGTAGIVPIYAGNTDIVGKPRPGGNDSYAIGCHEQQYV